MPISRASLSSTLALLAGLMLLAGVPPAAADPLTDLLPVKSGTSACFQRIYDAAHLKQHPRQAVTTILLSLRRETKFPDNVVVRLRVETRGKPEAALAGGSCDWYQEGVNRGQFSNAKLVPSFPKDSGLGCTWASNWQTAGDEQAQFPIDLATNGRSLTLYTREGVPLWEGQPSGELPLGTADRVFRLDRADQAACAALESAIPEPSRPD